MRLVSFVGPCRRRCGRRRRGLFLCRTVWFVLFSSLDVCAGSSRHQRETLQAISNLRVNDAAIPSPHRRCKRFKRTFQTGTKAENAIQAEKQTHTHAHQDTETRIHTRACRTQNTQRRGIRCRNPFSTANRRKNHTERMLEESKEGRTNNDGWVDRWLACAVIISLDGSYGDVVGIVFTTLYSVDYHLYFLDSLLLVELLPWLGSADTLVHCRRKPVRGLANDGYNRILGCVTPARDRVGHQRHCTHTEARGVAVGVSVDCPGRPNIGTSESLGLCGRAHPSAVPRIHSPQDGPIGPSRHLFGRCGRLPSLCGEAAQCL